MSADTEDTLQLADKLESYHPTSGYAKYCHKAAAELRRLYALNLWQDAELRRLLFEITEWEKITTAWLASPDIKTAITKTAIAKTKGII